MPVFLPAEVDLPEGKELVRTVLVPVITFCLRVTPELGLTVCDYYSYGRQSRTRDVVLPDDGTVAVTELAAAVREIGTRTSTIEWCSAELVYKLG